MEESPEFKPYEIKAIWLYKGVNIGKDGMLRCPHCNWILAEGRYPESPIKFICSRCKKPSEFQRLT